MPAKHAILAVALCATGAALVAPRFTTNNEAGREGRLLDELARLGWEAPAAFRGDAPGTPRHEKAVLEPETLFFEGPPSKTELIVPGLSVLTVIGIASSPPRRARPGSSTRSPRDASASSPAGGQDFTEIVYSDIAVAVRHRGSDAGDLVISLRDGAKLGRRFVPQFRETTATSTDESRRRRRLVVADGRRRASPDNAAASRRRRARAGGVRTAGHAIAARAYFDDAGFVARRARRHTRKQTRRPRGQCLRFEASSASAASTRVTDEPA